MDGAILICPTDRRNQPFCCYSEEPPEAGHRRGMERAGWLVFLASQNGAGYLVAARG